jgi:hypothetical protein
MSDVSHTETGLSQNLSKKTLEGRIITGRGFSEYSGYLGVKPELLNNQIVLNFGAGGSNIQKDLDSKGINSFIVGVDIKKDPVAGDNILAQPFKIASDLSAKIENFPQNLRQKLISLYRTFGGTKGRTILQGDGRNLPFANQTFGTVLALYSTYQIPTEDKERVYRELLRVGKNHHYGPIFGDDFKLLSRLAAENNFEVVACQPEPRTIFGDVSCMIKSQNDYLEYMRRLKTKDRVKIPKSGQATATYLFGYPVSGAGGEGNVIILKKQDSDTNS